MIKDSEPRSFKEAMRDERWQHAMAEEIAALEANDTWRVESLSARKKAIDSKWVYRIKYNADGSIQRYKARLVIRGDRQVEGVDYTETFALTVKMVTIRTLLAVAAVRGWELHQMDVNNAFLHSDLSEEVYMRFPSGFKNAIPGMVCRLLRSLYGLKQAPRCWYAKLASALLRYGFKQCITDHSLFTFARDGARIHVLVYVDYLVIAGDDHSAIVRFKKYLGDCFNMKDFGVLKYFLGIEVARNRTGLVLSQRKYALDILEELVFLVRVRLLLPLSRTIS